MDERGDVGIVTRLNKQDTKNVTVRVRRTRRSEEGEKKKRAERMSLEDAKTGLRKNKRRTRPGRQNRPATEEGMGRQKQKQTQKEKQKQKKQRPTRNEKRKEKRETRNNTTIARSG